jgi:hypothetical protein
LGNDAAVSIIVKFFIAPDDQAAAAVVDHGPSDLYETREYGNFLPDLVMEEWDEVFADLDFPYVPSERGRRTVADAGSIKRVIAASDFMVASLAAASEKRLTKAAKRWAKLQAAQGEILGDFAETMLNDIADLARKAAGQGLHVYCWIC